MQPPNNLKEQTILRKELRNEGTAVQLKPPYGSVSRGVK